MSNTVKTDDHESDNQINCPEICDGGLKQQEQESLANANVKRATAVHEGT